ncbi:MAG: hypothetical protein AAGC88_03460 [Bacteroidota bacterium]
MLKPALGSLKFFIWYRVGHLTRSNWFFLLYQWLFNKNLGVVDDRTNLMIEGFPRSGNTFLYSIISDFQTETLRIAHHLHTLSQIKNALRLNTSAVIMVRDPIDAIVSFKIRNPYVGFATLANYYLKYHSFLLDKLEAENLLIVDFQKCINSPNETIKAINDKFNLGLRTLSEEQLKIDIINKIKEYDKLDNKSEHSNSLTVSVPTPEKSAQKRKLVDELEKVLSQSKRKELLGIYNKIIH